MKKDSIKPGPSPVLTARRLIRLGQGNLPLAWRNELRGILISQRALGTRVRNLAREIQDDFRGGELVIVALLTGTIMFLADLIRHLSIPLRLDFMGVSSYRAGSTPGKLIFTKELSMDVRARDVLLVDDILDSGKTLHRVRGELRQLGARRIRVCVLLEKRGERKPKVRADYVGFVIPNLFVVGYGLDFNESYRNLPFVAVLDPARYRKHP